MIILLPKAALEVGWEESITVNLHTPGRVVIESIVHNAVLSDPKREAAGTPESQIVLGLRPHSASDRWVSVVKSLLCP